MPPSSDFHSFPLLPVPFVCMSASTTALCSSNLRFSSAMVCVEGVDGVYSICATLESTEE